MTNVIFSSQTLEWVGNDRELLAFEIAIRNVNVSGLKKTHTFVHRTIKKDSKGNELFLLPQPPKPETKEVTRDVETTEVTDTPAMTKVAQLTPILDSDGKPQTYSRTDRMRSMSPSDEPIMVPIEDPDNENKIILVQEKDQYTEMPLYYGMTKLEENIPCNTRKMVDEQKKTEAGELVYLKQVKENVTTLVPQPPKEITRFDIDYSEGLSPSVEITTETKEVTFDEEPSVFTFHEVLEVKRVQLYDGTLNVDANIYALFTSAPIVQSETYADIRIDRISLTPVKGKVTLYVQLSKPIRMITGIIETTSNGRIRFSAGETMDTMTESNNQNTVILPKEISGSIYVQFENISSVPNDILSIGCAY